MTRLERGMTLVELLIVVSIIGIMASLALPNFMRFQAKSRSSEAKISLKGIYKAKKSVYAEKMIYTTGLSDFKVEGQNLYTYRAASAIRRSIVDGVPTVYTQSGNCAEAERDPNPPDQGGFTVNAAANLDADAFIDGWYINDANCIVNGGCCAGCESCQSNLNDAVR